MATNIIKINSNSEIVL